MRDNDVRRRCEVLYQSSQSAGVCEMSGVATFKHGCAGFATKYGPHNLLLLYCCKVLVK